MPATGRTPVRRLSPEQVAALPPQQQVEYDQALRREIALRSPLKFGVYTSKMTEYPHVAYVDRLIMAALVGRLYKSGFGPAAIWYQSESDPDPAEGYWGHPETAEPAVFKVALSEPPRHGKSYHVSAHLPAWYRTRFPDFPAILASYEADFASKWGRQARDIVARWGEDFGVVLRDDAKSANNWMLEGHDGAMMTAGMGGAITGKGFNLGIIDDPIKNAGEAKSEKTRENHIDWYLSTWKTRAEPHPADLRRIDKRADLPHIFTIQILMATRWHEGDLRGYIEENESSEWYIVNMPALAFDDPEDEAYGDPGRCVIGRSPGEPLCSSRMSRTRLKEIEEHGDGSAESGGKAWFQALYQGNPRIEDGGIIQRPFRYWRENSGVYALDDGTSVPVRSCYRFAMLDLAASERTRADWTVFSVWDVTPAPHRRLILAGRERKRIEAADHEQYLRSWNEKWQPSYVGIENKTYGTSLIQTIRRRGGVSIRPVEADTDKVTRALPFGDLVLSGLVYFPADAEWLPEWEKEHLLFPNATYDDQVDTSAMAAHRFNELPKGHRSDRPEPTTPEDKLENFINERIVEKQTGRRGGPRADLPRSSRRTGRKVVRTRW